MEEGRFAGPKGKENNSPSCRLFACLSSECCPRALRRLCDSLQFVAVRNPTEHVTLKGKRKGRKRSKDKNG